MFHRKLHALDYENAEGFKLEDEAQFRNVIVWLEDQKIRHYKIEDRQALRNTSSNNWAEALKAYLDDLGYEGDINERTSLLDWILGYAVRLEYGDNVEKYKGISGAQVASAGKTDNPLDNMDFQSADFKAGVASLSQLLQIPPHTDHVIVLKAVCLLVKEKLSKQAVEQAQGAKCAKNGHTIPLEKVDVGFETADYISAEAAKILRLLHIRDLRELQTQINLAIVKVQALIANPKTDTKLGKVGIGK